MDCMTISTFRSLEQQAIRQHRELKTKELGYKLISMETFGKEKFDLKSLLNEPTTEPTTKNGKIDYYA